MGGEVDAHGAEAGQHVRTEQTHRLSLAADLGQRGRGELLGLQGDPFERPRPRRHRLGRPGAADAGE